MTARATNATSSVRVGRVRRGQLWRCNTITVASTPKAVAAMPRGEKFHSAAGNAAMMITASWVALDHMELLPLANKPALISTTFT